MKRWKKILLFLLRILAGLKVKNLTANGKREAVASGATGTQRVNGTTGGRSLGVVATENAASSVSAPAVVTFGPRCSEPLPRWQVLSWLRWDCLGSDRMSEDSHQADSPPTDSPPTPPFREGSSKCTRRIDLIVIHCSDTRPSQNFTIEKLAACHKARGFGEWPGYHLYIRRDGTLYYCRPVSVKGCHVAGHNAHSIGVCYEGGHSDCPEYKYEDNRTAEQLVVMAEVVQVLRECYPEAKVVGHNELAARACPCFDVSKSTLAAKPPSVPPKKEVAPLGPPEGGEDCR